MEIWVADSRKGLMRGEEKAYQKMGPPGCALCAGPGRIFCAGQRQCACYARETGEMLFDFPVAEGICALEFLRGRIYALSNETDSISAYSARNGDLLFSAPAGVYPRGMAISPCGRYLAVAGGAAGEVLLMDDMLRCHFRHRVAGIACAVAFFPRMLGVLCAAGEMELSAHLLGVSPRGVTEEIWMASAPPCALCVLPEGSSVIGCHGRLYALRPDGKIVCCVPGGYPEKIRAFRRHILICDPWQGNVQLMNGKAIYAGEEPEDALLFL